MNVYRYLKIAASGLLPARVKLLGLWGLYATRRRMIGVFLDPVLACNLRCKMCYMSDPEGRAPVRGQTLTDADIERIARAFYGRALKLQIGCATEPTLYGRLPELIADARRRGVPYISLTSNGKLIAAGKVDLNRMADAGLDELTLSMHGTTREVYEELMPGARFDELQRLTQIIADVKRRHPAFSVRVNFTVNSLNLHDLEGDRFWSLWADGGLPDIIQLRPVQRLGNTAWTDFDLTPLKQHYDTTIGAIAARAKELGISCIAPTRDQIDEVATDQDGTSTIVSDMTYCYISPETTYKDDFLPTDTYDSYHRRRSTGRRLFGAIFGRNAASKPKGSKHLNYHVR